MANLGSLWGKFTAAGAAIRKGYPEILDFRKLVRSIRGHGYKFFYAEKQLLESEHCFRCVINKNELELNY